MGSDDPIVRSLQQSVQGSLERSLGNAARAMTSLSDKMTEALRARRSSGHSSFGFTITPVVTAKAMSSIAIKRTTSSAVHGPTPMRPEPPRRAKLSPAEKQVRKRKRKEAKASRRKNR